METYEEKESVFSFVHGHGEFIACLNGKKNMLIIGCKRSYNTDSTVEKEMMSLAIEFKNVLHKFVADDKVMFYDPEIGDLKSIIDDMAGGVEHVNVLE